MLSSLTAWTEDLAHEALAKAGRALEKLVSDQEPAERWRHVARHPLPWLAQGAVLAFGACAAVGIGWAIAGPQVLRM